MKGFQEKFVALLIGLFTNSSQAKSALIAGCFLMDPIGMFVVFTSSANSVNLMTAMVHEISD